MWFEKLTGFREKSPEQVRANLVVEPGLIRSLVNGRELRCGTLEIPALRELRERVRASRLPAGGLTVRETVADVKELHADPANAGALFQVASQFNLLEMTGPEVTPEAGVDRYEHDHTQGPACAIAAGAGTIYRNYLVEIGGQRGQTADRQIDCLADLGAALGNTNGRLWVMRNGYALASGDGLREVARRLEAAGAAELDELRGLLRIGIQWDTEVTIASTGHTVTQAYCSALPVAYLREPASLWEPFARLVLEAAYEATLAAAALNMVRTGNPAVYLTALGGGAFGNDERWIIDAMERALRSFRQVPLQVHVVAYRRSNPSVREMLRRFDTEKGPAA